MLTSISKLFLALAAIYGIVLLVLVVEYPKNPKRNTEVFPVQTPPNSTDFDNTYLAYHVLKQLDQYTPITIPDEEEREIIAKNHQKPYFGIIPEEDYCERHRSYFVNNAPALMNEMVFLTDHKTDSYLRTHIFKAIGVDIHPQIGLHQTKKEKETEIHRIRPEVNIFYDDTGLFMYRDVGKHFACLSQMSNHIPGHTVLYRKDFVVKSVSEYAKKFEDRPQCFTVDSYYPNSYLLTDKEQCEAFFKKFNSPKYLELKAKKNIVYMKKIGAGVHAGKGVFPVDLEEEQDIKRLYKNGSLCGKITDNFIMQDFIANPLLINGHKFDFRVYLLVASTNPVIAYYGDGYLRVSLQMYDAASTDKTVFLTNPQLTDSMFEIAKRNGSYHGMTEKELTELQSWTFDQLQDYLMETGKINDPNWLDNKLRPEFQKAMIHLVRMSQNNFAKSSLVYGLFGIDFMLDDDLNLWFIEANAKPGLTAKLHKKRLLIKKAFSDHFEIVFNLLKSRLKRVIMFVNKIVQEDQAIKLMNGQVFINNIEEKRREFELITRNYFEPEYEVSAENMFVKIIDENYQGEERYSGFLKKECF